MAGWNFDLCTREAEQKRIAELEARVERLRTVVYAVACGRTIEATTNEFDYQAHMVWGESEHEVGEALRLLQPGDLEDTDGAQTGN